MSALCIILWDMNKHELSDFQPQIGRGRDAVAAYLNSINRPTAVPDARTVVNLIVWQARWTGDALQVATTLILSLIETATSHAQSTIAVHEICVECIRRLSYKELLGEYTNVLNHLPIYLLSSSQVEHDAFTRRFQMDKDQIAFFLFEELNFPKENTEKVIQLLANWLQILS